MSIIFYIFNNFNANFWKITQNLRDSNFHSIVKFCHDTRKTDPLNIWRTPLDRKILHPLLFSNVLHISCFVRSWMTSLNSFSGGARNLLVEILATKAIVPTSAIVGSPRVAACARKKTLNFKKKQSFRKQSSKVPPISYSEFQKFPQILQKSRKNFPNIS